MPPVLAPLRDVASALQQLHWQKHPVVFCSTNLLSTRPSRGVRCAPFALYSSFPTTAETPIRDVNPTAFLTPPL